MIKDIAKIISHILPDKMYITLKYFSNFNCFPNFKNPRTYNEKLQWIKLYDRKPEYTKMVDKYEAKKYIASVVGDEYIIPTLGVWNKFDEIDFEQLPDKFVLKCTHDSGGLVICRDKNSLDYKSAKKIISKSLKQNYFWIGREWPYKNVKPRIIAEPYLEDDRSPYLTDYKFFCFNGEPKIMYLSKDKADDPRTDFFDMEFNHLPLHMRDRNADTTPKKPDCFEKMKELSKKLSKNNIHIRVDFYEVNGAIYVGELTFFHCGGFMKIYPNEWNLILGNWINLPIEQKEKV